MSKPSGEGPYLLIVDYGSEGQSVQRYSSEESLLEAVTSGNYSGPIILARELHLFVTDAGAVT